MRSSSLFTLATLLLLSCFNNSNNKTARKGTDSTDSPSTTLPGTGTIHQSKLQPGVFKQLDSTGIVVIPLLLDKELEREHRILSSYSGGGTHLSWNLLFYNTLTGQIRPLDESRKMVIHNYDYKKKEAPGQGLIFYQITVTDYNQDGKLDYDDPIYLFVSQPDGTAFRQLSPDNVNLVQWEQIEGSSLLLMTAQRNSNGDKAFDEKDELIVYQIDLAKETNPSVSLPKELEQRLKTSFWKQWGDKRED